MDRRLHRSEQRRTAGRGDNPGRLCVFRRPAPGGAEAPPAGRACGPYTDRSRLIRRPRPGRCRLPRRTPALRGAGFAVVAPRARVIPAPLASRGRAGHGKSDTSAGQQPGVTGGTGIVVNRRAGVHRRRNGCIESARPSILQHQDVSSLAGGRLGRGAFPGHSTIWSSSAPARRSLIARPRTETPA